MNPVREDMMRPLNKGNNKRVKWRRAGKRLVSLTTVVLLLCSFLIVSSPVSGTETAEAAENITMPEEAEASDETDQTEADPIADPIADPTADPSAEQSETGTEGSGSAVQPAEQEGNTGAGMAEYENGTGTAGYENGTDTAGYENGTGAAGYENAGGPEENQDPAAGDPAEIDSMRDEETVPGQEGSGEDADGADTDAAKADADAKKADEDAAEAEEEDSRETADGEREKEAFVSAVSPLIYVGDGYTVKVNFPEEAMIPEGAYLVAQPVPEDHADYEEYKMRALDAVQAMSGNPGAEQTGIESAAQGANGSVNTPILLGLFDLTIYDAQGRAIEPQAPVTITASVGGTAEAGTGDVYAVHFVGSDAVNGIGTTPDAQAQDNGTGTAPGAQAQGTGLGIGEEPGMETGIGTGAEPGMDSGIQDTQADAAAADTAAGGGAVSGETITDEAVPMAAPVAFVPAESVPADQAPVEVITAGSAGEDMVFETGSFSVYALVVTTTIEETMLSSDGHNYRISVTYDQDAGIPEGAQLEVREIVQEDRSAAENAGGADGLDYADGASEYEEYLAMTRDTMGWNEGVIPYARFFDISIVAGGQKIQPAAGSTVRVDIRLADRAPDAAPVVVHFADGAQLGEVLGNVESVIEAENAAAGTELSAADAQTTPAGSENEFIAAGTGEEAASAGISQENTAGTAAVYTGETELSFETTGFSVYAIVDAPEPAGADNWTTVSSLDDLKTLAQNRQGLYMSHVDGYYFTDGITNIKAGRTGITKTGQITSLEYVMTSGAVRYYFELKDGTDDQFYVYCMESSDGVTRKYIKQSTDSLSFTTAGTSGTAGTPEDQESSVPPADATAFTVTCADGIFRMLGTNGYYWNMQGGAGGQSFAAYTGGTTDPNARISLRYPDQAADDDPFGLDGMTYGIAYHNDTAAAAALMAAGKDAKHMVSEDMLMRPDVLDNDGVLLVAEDSDISMWTFHSVSENRYYISTETEEGTKYLKIDTSSGGAQVPLLLADQAEASLFTLAAGTGANVNKYSFKAEGYYVALDLSGQNTEKGFWAANTPSWLNLVVKSDLDDDAFNYYTAKKVSVSKKHTKVDENGDPVLDENGDPVEEYDMPDGAQVVIYTRIWNDSEKKYEFYVVDHDGSLVRSYDTGDGIEWIGSTVNTALWDFTEYYEEGTTTPNYYYELQNVQYDNYIAPQLTGGQIFSDKTIGINLNGRRYGENYSTIIAWDEYNYSYSGLKAENGHVVSCPLSEADDFYFAIVEPDEPEDKLTTVETIDSTAYGITMKMVDFNNPIQNQSGAGATNSTKGRDSGQTAVLGYNTNAYGLVSTDLKENGYPVTMPAVTKKDEASLAQLFGSAAPVNHLFLQSIYNESGYFEYDSTQNFAHLNTDGNFTVYDQVGAVSDYTGITGQHGQFMPYNDLTEGKFCDKSKNNTSVLAEELPDVNARKGEKLYDIGKQDDVDYFFGMELEASFTQTVSGLDAWGHDIIFEFSGDDDFWLYVDGELILDVGGVHAASVGTVNFRTGEVRTILRNTSGGTDRQQNTTLRALFESNYRSRNPQATNAEVKAYLSNYFEEGSAVFKDYSNHTMKMLYMERGAGASNLHMRFNLAAVQPGHVYLSKKLSGTESASDSLIEFPYQIWYTSKTDGQEHLLGEKEGDAGLVMYAGTNNAVTYKESWKAAGVDEPYPHVFLLKPGQTADIAMPKDAVDYRIVECGVNPAVYNEVRMNGELLTGDPARETAAGTEGRKDYSTGTDTLANRQQVEYINHVDPEAVRTLSVSKVLYDEYGHLSTYKQDDTPFSFRLYLGNESTDPDSLPGANLYTYYVKDAEGHYCRWNADSQKFESLAYTDFDDLKAYLDAETTTALERESIVFTTSPNGAISRIPAQHTIEVRGLLVGTRWKIEERDNEIPKGYTRRNTDGYVRTDLDNKQYIYTETEAGYGRVELDPENPREAKPISDIIEVKENPAVEVRNQRGWGLTVEKVWTDKDFMQLHDPVYFAVYLDYDSAQAGAELYPGTVRQLKPGKTELYYFFDDLYGPSGDSGHAYRFADYIVREVTISTPDSDVVLDENGAVTNPGTVTPVEPEGFLTIGGTPVGGEYKEDGFTYTVSYEPGDPAGAKDNANIRTDVVTNSRPGIRIQKMQWDYTTPLAGSVFTLKDAAGNDVAAASYTSGRTGLVTTAYLNPGTEEEPAVYKLTETGAPEGYTGLDAGVSISVWTDEEGESMFAVSGPEAYYQFAPASKVTDPETGAMTETMASLTIRNRTEALAVKKTDAVTGDPLPGAHFALYRQVEDIHGNKQRANTPEPGYENIVTDENGILPDIDAAHLTRGLTYYLHETAAPTGYDKLDADVCFTYGKDGKITVESGGLQNWVTAAEDLTEGTVTYTLAIPNGKVKYVSFLKVDLDAPDSPLEGAKFDLYAVKDGVRDDQPLYKDLTSGTDGLLVCDEETVFALPTGTYHLVETQAPDGYLLKSTPVVITVADQDDKASVDFGEETALHGVTYDEGTDLSTDSETGISRGMKYDVGTKLYTLKITDKAGSALPLTGGPGTKLLIIVGGVLTACAALLLWRKRRYYDC